MAEKPTPPEAQNVKSGTVAPSVAGGPDSASSSTPDLVEGYDPNRPKIEQTLLGIPSVRSVKIASVYTQYNTHLAPKLRQFFKEVSPLFDSFPTHDHKVRKFCEIIKIVPENEQKFINFVMYEARRDEAPELSGGINMLGLGATRNWILNQRMWNLFKGTEPEKDKRTGLNKQTPAQILKYATRCEDSNGGEGSANSHLAYVAGLIYDIFALYGADVVPAKKAFLEYLDSTYTHGIRSGLIAKALARYTVNLELAGYLFATGVLHDAGKVALTIFKPEYMDLDQRMEGKKLPRQIRFYVEERIFQTNHAVMGTFIAYATGFFSPGQLGLLFHHEPNILLRPGRREEYNLAALTSLATNVATNFRKPVDGKDPVINHWRGLELRDF
ncbi:MAG: HDOD domain-containing protein [Bdellovibrionota bacterium]